MKRLLQRPSNTDLSALFTGGREEEMRKLRLKFKLAVVFLFYLNILGFTFGR